VRIVATAGVARARGHARGRTEVGNGTRRGAREGRIVECSDVGEGSSDTLERSATGKQNVTITICARSVRGKINDLTLSAGTSALSRPRLLTGGNEGADVKVTSSLPQ